MWPFAYVHVVSRQPVHVSPIVAAKSVHMTTEREKRDGEAVEETSRARSDFT